MGALHVAERVGGGAYGEVYRAHDRRLDRAVALKLLLDETGEGSPHDSPVIEEARLLARLRHPNVVTVYGAERIDGRTGIWMEFLEGRTLEAELAARGSLPAAEVLEIGIAVCRALDAAHRAGVLHRDLNGQNVMRAADGTVRLTDFGTGRDVDRRAGHELVGTPLYLAPEVLGGGAASVGSDLYSLGVLLFRLATGAFPLQASSLSGLRELHARCGAGSVRQVRCDLPDALLSVIDRAIDSDANRRFESAAAMETALAAATTGRAAPRLRLVLSLLVALSAAAAAVWLYWEPAGNAIGGKHARDSVLIAAFDNQTGDSVLDGTVEYVLERELGNSPFLNVVGRDRVEDALRLMQKPLDARLDLDVAREVCRRDGGIRALVTGFIQKVGGRYAIGLQVVRAADGVLVAGFSGNADTFADLQGLVRRQAIAFRRALGEKPASLQAALDQLEKVTTPSLRALQLYSRAAALMQGDGRWNNPGAEVFLRDALQEDPTFASAHLLIAWAIHNQDRPQEEYLPHAQEALRLTSTVSDPERYFISGSVHQLHARRLSDPIERNRELALAVGDYEAVLAQQPDHPWALTNIQSVYSSLGLRLEELAVVTRLAEARPNSFELNVRALTLSLLAGDLPQAERYAASAAALLESASTSDAEGAAVVRLFPALRSWLSDDAWGALGAADAVATLLQKRSGSDRMRLGERLAEMYLTLGASGRARQIAESLPDDDSYARDRVIAYILWQHRDVEQLRHHLATLVRNHRASWRLTPMFIDMGMLAEARDLLRHQRDYETGRSFMDYGALRLKLAAPDFDDTPALHELADTLRAGSGPEFLPRDIGLALALADRLEASGESDRALRLLESYSFRRTTMTAFFAGYRWIELRARLADLYRRAGRQLEAREVERELLRLLATADTDLPLLIELKARTATPENASSRRQP